MADTSDGALVADAMSVLRATERAQLADRVHRAITGQLRLERPLAEGLTIADAYRISAEVAAIRAASGDRRVGRKFGFTNRSLWPLYGVFTAIVGDTWESTVTFTTDGRATLSVGALSEPRLEPEIVLGLGAAPMPGMDKDALAGTVDWVAIGSEIVQSAFPGWVFDAAEATAIGSLHGRLVIGPTLRRGERGFEDVLASLEDLELVAARGGAEIGRGHGRNALDGPLAALANAVATLADHPSHPPIGAGECVTTGTLTDAFPVAPGETWTVTSPGGALARIEVSFVA